VSFSVFNRISSASNSISMFIRQSLKDHIMQVHQPSADSPTASINGIAQHFSPTPSLLSPGHFPYNMNTGAHEGGRQSHSPNSLNTHACSYNQCSASFPTLELLEKHEMIQHSSGATNVVSLPFDFDSRVMFPAQPPTKPSKLQRALLINRN
jgi:hypothetical protein